MNKLQQRIEALERRIKPPPSVYRIYMQKAVKLLTDDELSAGTEFCELCLAGRWEEIKPEQLTAHLRAEQIQAELMATPGIPPSEDSARCSATGPAVGAGTSSTRCAPSARRSSIRRVPAHTPTPRSGRARVPCSSAGPGAC